MDNDVELDIDPRKGSVYHKRMKSALPNMIKKEDPAVTNTVHRQRATKLVLILLLVPRFFFFLSNLSLFLSFQAQFFGIDKSEEDVQQLRQMLRPDLLPASRSSSSDRDDDILYGSLLLNVGNSSSPSGGGHQRAPSVPLIRPPPPSVPPLDDIVEDLHHPQQQQQLLPPQVLSPNQQHQPRQRKNSIGRILGFLGGHALGDDIRRSTDNSSSSLTVPVLVPNR